MTAEIPTYTANTQNFPYCHAHLKITNIFLSSLVLPVYFGIQDNFSLLLETLANKLHAEGLILTVAVAASPNVAEQSYNFEKVGE